MKYGYRYQDATASPPIARLVIACALRHRPDDDRQGFVAADALNPQKARGRLRLGPGRTREARAWQARFFAY